MSADSKASPHVNGEAFDAKAELDPSRAMVPAVARVNERRVARGFWPKIRRVAAKVPFASDALSGRAGKLAALATRALAASGDGTQLDALWPTLATARRAPR